MKLFLCELKFGKEWKALFLVKGYFRDAQRGLSSFAELHGYALHEVRLRRVKSQAEKDQHSSLTMLGGNIKPFEWVE